MHLQFACIKYIFENIEIMRIRTKNITEESLAHIRYLIIAVTLLQCLNRKLQIITYEKKFTVKYVGKKKPLRKEEINIFLKEAFIF